MSTRGAHGGSADYRRSVMRLQHSGGERSACRARTAFLVVLAVACAPLIGADSAAAALTSAQVAAEILRVQGVADDLAEAWTEAQLRSDELQEELAVAQQQLDQTSAAVTGLEQGLADIAVDRFTGASTGSMFVVFGDPQQQMQADALRSVALNAGADDLDELDAARSDLDDARARLVALQDENTQLSAELADRQTELEEQLADLEVLRQQLEDDEVRQAYEAQLAAQRQQEAEALARATTTTVATTAAPKGSGAQPVVTVPASTPPAVAPPATTPTTAQPVSSAPTATAPTVTAPPVTAPPVTAPVVSGGDGWQCPIAGPSAFGDTWGAARSGGRTHQGVDMMSPLGTPLVAVVAGTATMRTNTLGGNVVSLMGVDGNRYYYAHLSAWEGSSRSVSAGEVIGYVGHTGNTTANHLHFEIHPGGGAAINPYSTVRKYC
jgi:murein DD-endopeptidase MepM/ murein hydrolase activator NlpD